jgi:hypothetical protein
MKKKGFVGKNSVFFILIVNHVIQSDKIPFTLVYQDTVIGIKNWLNLFMVLFFCYSFFVVVDVVVL